MGSLSSDEEEADEQQSERCVSYSLSADVSESESSPSFSYRRYDADGASSSVASSPFVSNPLTRNFSFSVPPLPTMMLPVIGGKDVVVWKKSEKRDADLSEVELMKERFAKLLLGEDMSGGGKGVCSALAISNAITNLSATVFGELWRLEPLASQKKAMWRREMEWFLSVSDHIVELVPSVQQVPGGGSYEVMSMQPRSDLCVNLPGLKKLDNMLINLLEEFIDKEFWYVDRGIIVPEVDEFDGFSSSVSSGRPSIRQEEKWWLPYPKVPSSGLSDDERKRLQQSRDCTNQILKAAMAINSNVLAEMEIPSAYLENLPKSGKSCLGDNLYRHIIADQFSPDSLFDSLNLSSEHQTLDIANRIEAVIHVWQQKDQKKHKNHPKTLRTSWSGKVKDFVAADGGEKNQFLAQRAESTLRCLRLRFPALPQTALEMNKIQYNKDVGQSLLESYSRVMESLAFNIMARIDDVLYVDDDMKKCIQAKSHYSRRGLGGLPLIKRMSPSPFSIQHTPYSSPFATPTFCSSTPIPGSPKRGNSPVRKLGQNNRNESMEKGGGIQQVDMDKLWTYAGNLGVRKAYGDAPERD